MGAEEGRAFYWRTPGGSNGCFSSHHQHLWNGQCRRSGQGTPPPSAILADARVG
jgi:hypothetical protein